jgi:16S rRNA (cytidine1402-2'-O)-methyltransferase
MGTLYVVGAPPGDLDDLTLRARRILTEVNCVATNEPAWAWRLLSSLGIEAAIVDTEDRAGIWNALSHGDVALLFRGLLPGPSGLDLELIRAAIDGGVAVVPVPGPALPITSLVIAGLPTDSFVFLGELPSQPPARRALLASVTAERRTLVAVESPGRLPSTLADLSTLLGDRLLAIVTEDGQAWRGSVGEAMERAAASLPQGKCALVIAGFGEQTAQWDEERLRAEIVACLEGGLRAREISQQLAAASGWPRREIYRLVVEQSKSATAR